MIWLLLIGGVVLWLILSSLGVGETDIASRRSADSSLMDSGGYAATVEPDTKAALSSGVIKIESITESGSTARSSTQKGTDLNVRQAAGSVVTGDASTVSSFSDDTPDRNARLL